MGVETMYVVQEDLGGDKAGGLGAEVARIVDEVTTHGEADAAGVGFGGTVGDNNAGVGGFAAGRNGCVGNEKHRVSSLGGQALGGCVALG